MTDRRPFWIGAVAAGVLAWIIVGALVLSDAMIPATPTLLPVTAPSIFGLTHIAVLPSETRPATSTFTPSPTASIAPSVTPAVVLATDTPVLTLTASYTAAPPTAMPTGTPIDTAPAASAVATDTISIAAANGTPGCVVPAGWTAYHVSDGDTLFGFQLGSGGTVTVETIMKANCLASKFLTLGQVIYLPAGVGQKAPKLDDSGVSGGGTPLPVGLTRVAHCPCTAVIHLALRREQVAALIDYLPVGFTGGDFLAVTGPNAPTSGFSFLSGKPPSASFEGFLFPGTYTIQNSTSALDFRNQLLAAFDAAIPGQWRQDVGSHGLNLYQAVILASIIQREARDPADQVKVASALYNTMAAGHGLASTPTVQYIFGHPGAWWPNVGAAELKSTSPYNTYHYVGLPPTPIDSPDINAIRAAVYPAQTNFMYFADCNGVNFYTETYAEFSQQLKNCP